VAAIYRSRHDGRHRELSRRIFRFIREVPALVAIGVWFAFQLISSLGMFSGGAGGGVAYGAHIGGFIAGLIFVKFFLIVVHSKGRLSFP
jgi:membrane associated rhomboid family serine protease